MSAGQSRTPGAGDAGGLHDRIGTGSVDSLQPGCDTGVVPRASIVCRYAGSGNAAACGAFDTEHHARAADAGACCAVLAFIDVGQDQGDADAPTGADWPDFAPTDDDIPGGRR